MKKSTKVSFLIIVLFSLLFISSYQTAIASVGEGAPCMSDIDCIDRSDCTHGMCNGDWECEGIVGYCESDRCCVGGMCLSPGYHCCNGMSCSPACGANEICGDGSPAQSGGCDPDPCIATPTPAPTPTPTPTTQEYHCCNGMSCMIHSGGASGVCGDGSSPSAGGCFPNPCNGPTPTPTPPPYHCCNGTSCVINSDGLGGICGDGSTPLAGDCADPCTCDPCCIDPTACATPTSFPDISCDPANCTGGCQLMGVSGACSDDSGTCNCELDIYCDPSNCAGLCRLMGANGMCNNSMGCFCDLGSPTITPTPIPTPVPCTDSLYPNCGTGTNCSPGVSCVPRTLSDGIGMGCWCN